MNNNEILDHIEEILDAMERIQSVLAGVDFHKFTSNYRTRFAINRSLEIIEKATKMLPISVKVTYPEIPWEDLAVLYENLSDGYDQSNLRAVWSIVKTRIPEYIPLLDKILLDSESA